MSTENEVFRQNYPEAPQTTETIDLRLFSAFKVWGEFKAQHQQELATIKSLEPHQVTSLANNLADSVYKAIGFDPGESGVSRVSKNKLTKLVNAASPQGNTTIFVRHAEQSPPEWVFSIPRQDIRKIRMMQNPFNNEDLITNKAVAEAFSTGFSLHYLKAVTGKNLRIVSSENMRALEIAKVISHMVEDTTIRTDAGLTCITYKDERDEPSVTFDQLLADLPSGFMPWVPELVDKWCKETKGGKKPSQAIVESVGELYTEGLDSSGNDIIIALTHSQQLGEVLSLAGKLNDPGARFPELSMFVVNENSPTILRRGILQEETEMTNPNNKKKDLRKILEKLGGNYDWYKIRRDEFQTNEKIPFLVSPEPFGIITEESVEIQRIGDDVVAYMDAVDKLYKTDGDVKDLLDTGKPAQLRIPRGVRYLFVRPDLVISEEGFSICEIETSPFGLALAELLNKAYASADFTTMVPDGTLSKFLKDHTPNDGTIVYGPNTEQYKGQLQFLAKELMSGEGRSWDAQHIDTAITQDHASLYRGFYLHELFGDLFIHNLVESQTQNGNFDTITPSLTPHMEEKAALALVWDKRWGSFFRQELGESSFEHLRQVIPPTWIIGQEQHFSPGLPGGVESTLDLANISKSKRNFVLKKSGFGYGSSWAEGVTFLQEKSTSQAKNLLEAASRDISCLYIVQEFRKSREIPLTYDDKINRRVSTMNARVRITPYFSMVDPHKGQLVAIKTTGCENTNYIHASTGSINTAVSVQGSAQ